MTHFIASAEIAAPPATVWETLLDTRSWPTWDTSLDRVEGSLEPGGRVTIHVTGSSRAFPLRVVEHQPARLLVLRGGMPLGLFSGTRRYQLDALGADRTAFTMEEAYAGPLASLITRSIPDLQPAFDAFAAGLTRAAEA